MSHWLHPDPPTPPASTWLSLRASLQSSPKHSTVTTMLRPATACHCQTSCCCSRKPSAPNHGPNTTSTRRHKPIAFTTRTHYAPNRLCFNRLCRRVGPQAPLVCSAYPTLNYRPDSYREPPCLRYLPFLHFPLVSIDSRVLNSRLHRSTAHKCPTRGTS